MVTNVYPQKIFAAFCFENHLNISECSLCNKITFVETRKRMVAAEDTTNSNVYCKVKGAKVGLADFHSQSLLCGLQFGLTHAR